MEPESFWAWCLLAIAAFGIGFSKSGFSGVSMVHVIVFAYVFGAFASTGVVLPMLIAGDVLAMSVYGKHANWRYVRRMMIPTGVGVVIGWLLMMRLPEHSYKPLIGTIILCLTAIQIVRLWKEKWLAEVPHAAWFAWSMGILVGFTTMLANAAGPVFGLYLLAIGLPKMEFVGTAAWFFLLLNVSKVPFSWGLGLIRVDTLLLNAKLLPMIAIGMWVGMLVIKRIPQRMFDSAILVLTAMAAVRMLFW
jgi:uncharacterized membrane protein YfcA